jgi:hypothetical protein
MLRSVISFISLICILFFASCSDSVKNRNIFSNNDGEQLSSNKYVVDNFNSYASIYSITSDSANKYSDSVLKGFSKIFGESWQIDSFICINNANDKLVATINNSNGIGSYASSDDISKLLGKKINGVWYFFKGGGTLIIPRNMYGKDEMHPLTFHELSQIGRKNFLESALIKNAAGEYVVNDKWVDDHFYQNGFGNYKSKAEYDSVHWMMILQKWKYRIDTNEYKPLHRKVQPKPAV